VTDTANLGNHSCRTRKPMVESPSH